MLPISDMNPTRQIPWLTYGLIAANLLVFVAWELPQSQSHLQSEFMQLAVVPANIAHAPFSLESILDILRSTFFHGGWEHILGNMLYLYLFGDNVEDRLGKLLYLPFYLICGFAASYAQVLIDPTSTIPNIGASGAIAGVLGAYLIMFPGVKVRGIVALGNFSTLQEWSAIYVLGMWFVLQLVSGFASLGTDAQYGGGVAFFAHIGGFVVGIVLAFILMRVVPQPPPDERRDILNQRAQNRYY